MGTVNSVSEVLVLPSVSKWMDHFWMRQGRVNRDWRFGGKSNHFIHLIKQRECLYDWVSPSTESWISQRREEPEHICKFNAKWLGSCRQSTLPALAAAAHALFGGTAVHPRHRRIQLKVFYFNFALIDLGREGVAVVVVVVALPVNFST